MNPKAVKRQRDLFEKAKRALVGELADSLRDWDYLRMKDEFRHAVFSRSKDRRHAVRSFVINVMKIKGDVRYLVFKHWLADKNELSLEEMIEAMRALNSLHQSQLVSLGSKENAEIVRQIIDFAISSTNSTVNLIISANVQPHNVTESDRMELQSAWQEYARRFGFKINFN